jgi:uncharacterized protein YlxP (DUF503 family)
MLVVSSTDESMFLQRSLPMKQKEAVVKYVIEVLGEDYNPSVAVSNYITKDQQRTAIDLMVAGFESGEVDLKDRSTSKREDSKVLRTYASSVVSNWIRKSKELNGGVDFENKNPGSRTNPQIKQALLLLKELQSSGADEARIQEVSAFIEETREALKASKPIKTVRTKKVKELDLSAIPESLRSLVG